jgi:Mg-chelatase subunit ChlD
LTSIRLAPLLLLLVGISGVARADEAVSTFKKAWAKASASEDPKPDQKLALRALSAGQTPACAKLLARYALSQEIGYEVRDDAQTALFAMGTPEVLLWASKALEGEERDPAMRVLLCDYLAARAAHDAGAGMLLLPALEDKQLKVQAAAIRGLGSVRRPVVVAALIRCLAASPEGRVASDCRRTLHRLTGVKQKTPEDWTKWWAAVEQGYTFDAAPDSEGPDDPTAGDDEPLSTVTRRPPPVDAGETIYEELDSHKVVFVVDLSGSMRVRCQDEAGISRSRMDYVKEQLMGAIASELEDGARFNVIGFSTGITPWKKKLVKATDKTRKKARSWIHKVMQPNGETNIYGALRTAFKHKDVDTIYFLTDGYPTAGEETVNDTILGKVRAWNVSRRVRIHTIAFLAGDGAQLGIQENKGMSRRFLKKLASQNDGNFKAFE